jgi:hypothetical protein
MPEEGFLRLDGAYCPVHNVWRWLSVASELKHCRNIKDGRIPSRFRDHFHPYECLNFFKHSGYVSD